MGKWAITLSAWVTASLWLSAVQAAEDNLYFSGTLVNEPCVLDERDELIKLDFKSVIDKDLYLNGRTRGNLIDLHLKNCDLDVGKRMVSITFNGNESSALPGLLVLQSASVQGLLVGLETTGGEALPLNKSHRMGELSSGNNLVSFNAYLQGEPEVLANRALGLGDFEASLTFALSYE
ncbi:fimbrial protein [Pseudomonas mucidolens]|uniref:Pilin (Type 1 fimbria component protein) n=1 Tax=Pseudomonas mucidolens TaxID=46679 RepID=A0A1H2N275_9PSED|nr:fimbrial protein [Pseudomonas mucidolens]SDU99619.1 Pilin (type 1 fimbria component protein) [Pseudomonas mucidolens]SQH32762.1 putative exported fimbrial protein [Pseudomonas mucidolens]